MRAPLLTILLAILLVSAIVLSGYSVASAESLTPEPPQCPDFSNCISGPGSGGAGGASPPSRLFQGRLVLQPLRSDSQIEVLADSYGVSARPELDVAHLPSVEVEFVQDGADVIPVQRGAQPGKHPYWEWIFAPGKAWDEPGSPGQTHVTIPFSIQERNQNCTHNGLLSFAFHDDGTITPASYLVGSETCKYFKANLRGSLRTDYQPYSVDRAGPIIARHRALLTSRLEVRPISTLPLHYPGADSAAFQPPGMEDVTVYGLVMDGIHYVGGCNTRFGKHPFCESLALPSYSTAKSVFAGLAYIYLDKHFPDFAGFEVGEAIDECRLRDGRWDDVTMHHLLNMSTGNYDDPAYEADEGAANIGEFFLPETHAAKLRFACRAYKRKAQPGEVFVYHTSDTYLLGTAMNEFLRRRGTGKEDVFNDILVQKLFAPLALSPLTETTRRSYDSAAQPFTGFGLTWTPDDVARIGAWLSREARSNDPGSLLQGEEFRKAMYREPEHIRQWAAARGEAYSNGFWGVDAAPWIGCAKETWIPFMSGYGGIVVALLPNGSVYYYFSDGDHFRWREAAVASHQIKNYCEE